MRHSCNEKWQTTHDGRSRTTKSRIIRTLGEKEAYKYLGILEADTIKQVEKKEKFFKSIPEEPENYSRQNSRYQDCSPRKILWAILEVDQSRT